MLYCSGVQQYTCTPAAKRFPMNDLVNTTYHVIASVLKNLIWQSMNQNCQVDGLGEVWPTPSPTAAYMKRTGEKEL